MKTMTITCLLALVAGTLSAQSQAKQPATVRIKKIENINGVSRVLDTTYVLDDKNTALMINQLETPADGKDGIGHVLMLHDTLLMKNMDGLPESKVMSVIIDGSDNITISDVSASKDGKTSARTIQKIVIMRKVTISDASSEDKKAIKSTGVKDNLSVSKLDIFPNPGKSQFTLNLEVPGDDVVKITISTMDGRVVDESEVKPVDGRYTGEIRISQPAGVYLMSVCQNGSRAIKKLIIE